MENRTKSKTRRNSDKTKQSKKKKSSDGPTCSTFLSQLTRKFMSKKKQSEISSNVVRSIVSSLTNTLPIQFTVRSPQKKESPAKIETIETFTPEHIYTKKVEISRDEPHLNASPDMHLNKTNNIRKKTPEMPVTNSEQLQLFAVKRKVSTRDEAVYASSDRDIAGEITKHVATLRKISLIAEEFNKKTAKNLKEIVDSVQQDLIKKLEEVKAEQRASTSEKQIAIK